MTGLNKGGRPPSDPVDLFFSHVEFDPNGGCWLWSASVNTDGYAKFTHRDRSGHRFAYRTFVGQIPKGLHLDHLCRVRCCVNPAHLEAVTPQENLLRGEGISARNARKTHCKHGHEFTPENIRWEGRKRKCRACQWRSNQIPLTPQQREAKLRQARLPKPVLASPDPRP